jgi:hypothetical protein
VAAHTGNKRSCSSSRLDKREAVNSKANLGYLLFLCNKFSLGTVFSPVFVTKRASYAEICDSTSNSNRYGTLLLSELHLG